MSELKASKFILSEAQLNELVKTSTENAQIFVVTDSKGIPMNLVYPAPLVFMEILELRTDLTTLRQNLKEAVGEIKSYFEPRVKRGEVGFECQTGGDMALRVLRAHHLIEEEGK